MKHAAPALAIVCLSFWSAFSQNTNPFVGRWDFDLPPDHASWLGITEKDGGLDVWYQPTGGNVYQVKDYKQQGSHLTLTLSPDLTWDLTASGGKLTGMQKQGTRETPLTGVRAPSLQRPEPKAWSEPEPLFDGKELNGWEPLDPAQSHWVARDGEMVNEAHGSNIKTTRKLNDFKLHIEFNCPDHGNSGVYLRGRYEVQIEYEPLTQNPPERRIGSIYGRIAPAVDLPRKPGAWESFDIMLVGRTVTIARDGVLTIDHREIEGITGGALDANEAEPGPFYLQGDHTGGLKFRNIRVQVPR
jgi:hypothetical protein